MRQSEYGSPFFAQDSGRQTNDPENQKKMAKILENYRRERQLDLLRGASSFSKLKCVVYPLLGFLGAKFFNDAFLGPKSYYLRMFIYFFSICAGYKVYNSSYQHQAYVSLLNDFQGPNTLPGPIQQMLENNDYRYAREFLQTAEVAAEKKE